MNGEYFHKAMWPSLADQFEITHNINHITLMTKGLSFFNYLQFYSAYKAHVERYFSENRILSSWNYVLDLVNLVANF